MREDRSRSHSSSIPSPFLLHSFSIPSLLSILIPALVPAMLPAIIPSFIPSILADSGLRAYLPIHSPLIKEIYYNVR